MVPSSPAVSNSSNDTAAAATNGGTPPRRPALLDPPKQNLRGLNKPKCFQCGNVARSRCPYQSCKSCCAKAQNPCHIHVLKSSAPPPDKPPLSTSPVQPSADASPSGTDRADRADRASSFRLSSLRQLSNNFAQFNGVQAALRARRPLSRKDAAAINAWRFSKLKEYNDRNIEAENESFDRYMQNVGLLEEPFFVNSSLKGHARDDPSLPDSAPLTNEDEVQKLILGIKVRLKSNVGRADKCRQKIRDIIDQGVRKLQKREFDDEKSLTNMDGTDGEEVLKNFESKKRRSERMIGINDLLDKLNKSRTEEELQACLEAKLQLFNQTTASVALTSEKLAFPQNNDRQVSDALTSEKLDSHQNNDDQMLEEHIDHGASLSKEETSKGISSAYCLPKLWRPIEVDKKILSDIDIQFSSPNLIVEL